jgi:hypothetical protein
VNRTQRHSNRDSKSYFPLPIVDVSSLSLESGKDVVQLFGGLSCPVIVSAGKRSFLLTDIPFDLPIRKTSTDNEDPKPVLHRPAHGELKSTLTEIAEDFELREGSTVPSKEVLTITNELRKRGLDVNFETVRSKLRRLGYYAERKS